MRACSMSEQDSDIPLDRRTFLPCCLGGGTGGMSQVSEFLVLQQRASKRRLLIVIRAHPLSISRVGGHPVRAF